MAAIKLFDRVIAAGVKKAPVYDLRGEVRLRSGDIEGAIADFDMREKLMDMGRQHMHLRATAYYYVGRFDDGANEFDGLNRGDRRDVSHALWHYACVAPKYGVPIARSTLPRVDMEKANTPFPELYAMYQGKLKPADVLAAANAGEMAAKYRIRKLFYSHFYIGLWHEAAGESKKAMEHLTIAVEKYKVDDELWYENWWDVAQVHVASLRKAAKTPAGEAQENE